MKKSTEELLDEISKKLDKLMVVTAAQGKNVNIQIKILRSFDWEWDDIGKIVGMTADAARMRHTRKKR